MAKKDEEPDSLGEEIEVIETGSPALGRTLRIKAKWKSTSPTGETEEGEEEIIREWPWT